MIKTITFWFILFFLLWFSFAEITDVYIHSLPNDVLNIANSTSLTGSINQQLTGSISINLKDVPEIFSKDVLVDYFFFKTFFVFLIFFILFSRKLWIILEK